MRRKWVAVARGDEPPDLVLTGGRVLSVFTGELFNANVAVVDGHIVGVGDYDGGHQHLGFAVLEYKDTNTSGDPLSGVVLPQRAYGRCLFCLLQLLGRCGWMV